MFTFAINQLLSSGLFHQDPLKKDARREISQLENDCYVVLDRLLDHCVYSAELCEDLLANAQTYRRRAEGFFKAKQYARAKMSAQVGNVFIRRAMQLNFRENTGLFFC